MTRSRRRWSTGRWRLPCRGTYVRQIGPHALLVTDEVRSDAAAYRAALDSFGRGLPERPSRA